MASGKLLWELRLIIDPESGQATNTRSDMIIDLTCDEPSHSSSRIPLVDLTCETDCVKASTSTFSGIPQIDTNPEGSTSCVTARRPWVLYEWEPLVSDSPRSPAYTRDRGLHSVWEPLFNSSPSSGEDSDICVD